MQVQKEIISQLGGNQFIAMTGANCFADGDNTLVVKFKGCKIANIMYITLNSLDLYDMRIAKFTTAKYKTTVTDVASFNSVCCEDLRPIFERTTKLRTSLTNIYA